MKLSNEASGAPLRWMMVQCCEWESGLGSPDADDHGDKGGACHGRAVRQIEEDTGVGEFGFSRSLLNS
ncbi:hypothetical protein V6N11_017573 [Hibiscus sabdariffa]|uniref:Uncharacterized protein n=1 Tax=Hibiscus sabdariffa TaxID=183260 RepID=A0ABR2TZ72_9ROSI